MRVSVNPQHMILWTYHPIRISTRKQFLSNLTWKLTSKTNSNFDFKQYSSYLAFIRPINWNQLLQQHIGSTINLSRASNTRSDHQLTKDMNSLKKLSPVQLHLYSVTVICLISTHLWTYSIIIINACKP